MGMLFVENVPASVVASSDQRFAALRDWFANLDSEQAGILVTLADRLRGEGESPEMQTIGCLAGSMMIFLALDAQKRDKEQS